MTTLVQKIQALAAALTAADLPHAFGGALALAFYTEDPRGTRDIDINAFVAPQDASRVLGALPAGVAVPPATAQRVAVDGQVRLWWDDTPVDLFFDYAPLHEQAARAARDVPFAGGRIRVLGPVELILFKALFDRPKDWVDIATVLDGGAVDAAACRCELARLVGADDPRLQRWDVLGAGG